MARKAATKSGPAPFPLNGCSVAIAGTFQGTSQTAIQQRLTNLGATVDKIVTSDTDWLLANQKEVDKNSAKVKAATSNNVSIVTIDWLQECESSHSKADHTSYLLSPLPTNTGSNQQKNATAAKRPASPSPTASAPPPPTNKKLKKTHLNGLNAQIGDGQNAKSVNLQIPVDEYCPLTAYKVYVQPDGEIFDASLNQTNASNNNNKFYRIQLLHLGNQDYKTWTRWGRVGERGQSAVLGDGSLHDAISHFHKKFQSKSGLKWEARGEKPKPGKYAYIERSYNPDSDDDEDSAKPASNAPAKRDQVQCTLAIPVQNLMALIFNQQYFAQTMSALNYDADKLPLGKLSKATINRGFQALKDLAALLNDHNLAHTEYGLPVPDAIEHLSNSYYSLIPHAFGRNRPPIIQSHDLIKREIELLESLGDMKEAAALMKSTLKDDSGIHPLDRQYQGLGMDEMEVVEPTSTEFAELFAYLNDSKGATHHVKYQVQDIFRIKRKGEFERFEKNVLTNIASNRRLLWHGSRVTNFGGILGQGLRIAPPEAPVSGYMFGKGIYLADMSSKSAGYCCSYNSGGTALILLCEAELGDPMQELTQASYNAGEDAKKKGLLSTMGKGRTGPSQWKDAKCVHPSLAGVMMSLKIVLSKPDVSVRAGDTGVKNASLYYNEYIVYDVAQVRLRYLFRVQM
ncbi:PARP-domain-containing protein [Westerdykella ornata]|uniref:Poly [ADP-ribose] polymerase n=1 Tax=Westerdykella ornata TaxID=318751 RepID=A0A6A6JVZ6_WESOR|nr:PARP-domain-containing protein [Westerdykella ornata]KAF2279988.1 PARP-domain-containing protein [Westerdykella ornata]